MQATSLPFIVAATAIGQELDLLTAAEGAALIGAGLLSVLLFPIVGLSLLRGGAGRGPARPRRRARAAAGDVTAARRLASRRPWRIYEAATHGGVEAQPERRRRLAPPDRASGRRRGRVRASWWRATTGSLKRLARSFGATEAVAEEIVQETWLAALQGLDALRGALVPEDVAVRHPQEPGAPRARTRAPLGSVLRARRRRRRCGRALVDPARFQGADGCWPDHWAAPPRPWEDPPRRLAALEARERIRAAISVTARRASGWSWPCATSTASTPRRSASCSRSARATSGCCCTGAAPAIRNALEEYLDG